MGKKFTKVLLALSMLVSTVLPQLQSAFAAGAEAYVVVDDTTTSSSNDHYFTFSDATSTDGKTGWVADTKGTIVDNQHADAAKTQHWVWNENYNEAKKHTYTFTFKGTGVELVGVKNDAQNTFKMDNENAVTFDISGAANQTTTLYSRKNLTYGTHSVTVTLPEGGTGLQVCYAKVYGNVEETTRIPFTQTSGDTNKFTYSPTGWSAMGGSSEHVWSDAPGSNPSDIYYEVKFVGHKIDVYAGKNHPMGMVEYFVDGVSKGKYSLFNSSNINSTLITTIDGLTEGEHTFRAVATGERASGSTNTLIDCADVVVYHAPYTIENITIGDGSGKVTLSEGATHQITYNVTPSYVTINDAVFASTNEKVATVSETGLITAQGVGTADIIIASAKYNATLMYSVEVTASNPDMGGSIVDVDTQYTQDRYNEVKNLGITSKTLNGWKNDTVISEISIVSKGSRLENVVVSASDLTGTKGKIDAANVETSFIKSTKAYNGSYLGYGNPTRPLPEVTASNRSESNDILYQDGSVPMTIPFNSVQNVWVSINIPKDVAAGTYTGKITVSAKGVDPLEFTYTVNVADATLSDASEFANGFDIELWQYPYTSAEYYGVEPFSKEHLEILKPIMALYKKVGGHAITTSIVEEAWSGQTYSANSVHYPSMIKWIKNGNTFTYDYTDFDAWVSFCKSQGLGDKIVLYSIAPWNNSIGYYENGTLRYQSFNLNYSSDQTIWKNFLKDLILHLEEKGWFEDAYMGIDERGFSATAFDLIESVKNNDLPHLQKPLKTAGAMDNFVNKWDLALRVTDLNVGDTAAAAHPTEFKQLLAEREAKGYRTTLYSCTEHAPGQFSLSAPVESYWAILNAGKMGTAGFLRWAYDAWVANPLEDTTHNAFEAGDCFLVYPSEKDAAVKTVHSSVRLERLAEGVRDVNKLMLMVKDVPALQAKVDEVYASIQFALKTQRNYLTDAQVQQLINETASFKEKLNNLTQEYIVLKQGGTDKVDYVEITAQTKTIETGATLQLNATVLPSNVFDNTVTWTSSNDKVATVDARGVVTGKTPGSVTITATSNLDATKKATVTITVKTKEIDSSKLVSYYSFDDVSGTTVKDSWGTRNGKLQGSAAIEKGKGGNALYVTTPLEGMKLEGSSGLGKTWTISYWVKATTDFDKKICELMDSTQSYAFSMKMDTSRESGFRVGTGSGDVLTIKYGFAKDNWYHMTWTQDTTDGISMYVNGVKVASNNWTASRNIKAPIDIIGGVGFTGYIDEVKVYNCVLTAEEIQAGMLVNGITVASNNVNMNVGETYSLDAVLVSDKEDKTLTYSSDQSDIVSVDENGVLTAHKKGTAIITVENKAGGFVEYVTVNATKLIYAQNTLPVYMLNEKYVTDIDNPKDDPNRTNKYLGQPDMVRTASGRLITAYPNGHGKGPLIMQISDNEGESWTMKKDIPTSWAGSQETPTLYVLNVTVNGKQIERIILVTACPGWGTDSNGNQYGWNMSYSDDNGDTWTEYEHYWSEVAPGDTNDCIVAMSSLVQLKDENGNYVEQWMGNFHNYQYVNYKTILTFDEDGTPHWSQPETYLSEYRSIESTYQMCEIGMFRSPDGKRIVGLARSQSHNNPSTLIYSDDEGKTWSKPMDLPGTLAGERHKAVYDPISGRLVITFREISFDLNGNNQFDGNSDWICEDWGIWVGTYEDLMNQEEGQYRIRIAEDWVQNAKKGDTGYAGIVVLEDGTFIMDSYGHWDKAYSESYGGSVTSDLCYIKQAKFKLGEFENDYGLIDYNELDVAIREADALDLSKYDEADANAFIELLAQVVALRNGHYAAQIQVDEAVKLLTDAMEDLTEKAEPAKNGWEKVDEKWYFYVDGVAQTGWVKDAGKWYFMDESGVMQTGWIKDNNKWYYLNSHMMTGWQKVDGQWYYLNSHMITGWLNDGGKWYFLDSAMKTGWVKDNGKWYFLDSEMKTGWILDAGKWYYMNSHMMSGWQKVNGTWYYLNNDMVIGWLKVGEIWYYFTDNAGMVTGNVTINGKVQKFSSTGAWLG